MVRSIDRRNANSMFSDIDIKTLEAELSAPPFDMEVMSTEDIGYIDCTIKARVHVDDVNSFIECMTNIISKKQQCMAKKGETLHMPSRRLEELVKWAYPPIRRRRI